VSPHTRELALRAAKLREAMIPAAPDPLLVESCDTARRLLDPEYRRARELADEIESGKRHWSGLTVDQVMREEHRTGLGWEHRHACPDCFSFRAPASASCSRCRSTARPIPAHERAKPSESTRRRAAARRQAKRRK
jgi:hypothetical protein